MPQLSLYLDDVAMEALRTAAADAGLSMSKYANRVLGQSCHAGKWPAGYWDLYGSIADPSFVEPPELDWADDAPRPAL